MRTFSIAEVEQFSLIKAHTVRIWERRYGILKSQRTASNIRTYSLEDFTYLLDLSILNRFGTKISELAPLDKHTITEKLHDLTFEAAKKQHQLNQLVVCMFSLNIEDFELILDGAIGAWGIEQTIEEIILPFLERLELFSYEKRSSGEYHFVVTALRKKLILGIEQTVSNEHFATSVLLFLPHGEHFDLLLLYLNYQLKKAGLNVLYLGTNVTVQNLQEVIARKQPRFVVTYVSPNDKKSLQKLSLCFQESNGTTLYFVATAKLPKDYDLPLWNIKLTEYKEVPQAVLQLTQQIFVKKVKSS